MSKRSLIIFLIASFAFTTVSVSQEHSKVRQPTLTPQNSGTTQGLIAVSPVDSRVVWASGRGGTFVVTTIDLAPAKRSQGRSQGFSKRLRKVHLAAVQFLDEADFANSR